MVDHLLREEGDDIDVSTLVENKLNTSSFCRISFPPEVWNSLPLEQQQRVKEHNYHVRRNLYHLLNQPRVLHFCKDVWLSFTLQERQLVKNHNKKVSRNKNPDFSLLFK